MLFSNKPVFFSFLSIYRSFQTVTSYLKFQCQHITGRNYSVTNKLVYLVSQNLFVFHLKKEFCYQLISLSCKELTLLNKDSCCHSKLSSTLQSSALNLNFQFRFVCRPNKPKQNQKLIYPYQIQLFQLLVSSVGLVPIRLVCLFASTVSHSSRKLEGTITFNNWNIVGRH